MEKEASRNELLARYLAGETDAQESADIEHWISAHPDNRSYFEDFTTAWELMQLKGEFDHIFERIDVDKKWEAFSNQVIGLSDGPDAQNINELQPLDYERPSHSNYGKLSAILKVVSLVAAAILLFFISKEFFSSSHPKAIEVGSIHQPLAKATMRHQVNNTNQVQSLTLPDGSIILLSPHSSLDYMSDFKLRRAITLKGEAIFTVAHDSTHPFTVTSGDISTTALGTRFKVNAYEPNVKIKVHLYEGRVVIRQNNLRKDADKKEVFLNPGEEYVYNKQIASSEVDKRPKAKVENKAKTIAKNQVETPDNPLIPLGQKGSWYMFNNQDLSSVLKTLASMYDVDIDFSEDELSDIYFTGTYSRNQRIEAILKRICRLNGLDLRLKDSSHFMIGKH